MADRVTIKGAGMVVQSFSLEERSAYTKMINNTLADVEPCKKYLPMDPNSDDVFERLGDGVMLCFLINKAVPGTIDEKKIVTKENMNPFLKGENIKLGLNGAKQIGIKVVGVGTDTFRDYEKEKILLLGIIWQVVKAVRIKN
ncbi:MAG: hypothetical protein MJ252_28535 [archaeon]|nr:hypothetical protein [archaeon]